jgi:hypothetical protein
MLNYYLRAGRFASHAPGDRYDDLRHMDMANLPSWAQDDPYTFFDTAYTHEGIGWRYASVIMGALPRELSREEQIALMHTFLDGNLSKHPYVWVLHEKPARDGSAQPHVHLIFSQREHDGIDRNAETFFRRANTHHPERGGARKHPRFKERQGLERLRESWATVNNWALERAGHAERIDHRSLYRQGIERVPRSAMVRHRDEEMQKAMLHWDAYKMAHAFPDMPDASWLVHHIQDRAYNGVPKKAWAPRTPEDRIQTVQKYDRDIEALRQYGLRLHGAQEVERYMHEQGRPLTQAQQERHHRILTEDFHLRDTQDARSYGRARRVRIFEDERAPYERKDAYERES